MFKAIKKAFYRKFKRPALYHAIAKRLQGGAEAVAVTFPNGEYRFYKGSGMSFGKGFGSKSRWNVTVFNKDGQDEYIWMNSEELQRVQTDHLCYIHSAVVNESVSADDRATAVNNIVSRLRRYPYTQYDLGLGNYLRSDSITENGYKFYKYDGSWVIVPRTLMHLDLPQLWWDIKDYDKNNVSVYDQEKVKREHRPDHDFNRWGIIKEYQSIGDPWVFSITSTVSAKQPVRYFGFELHIDSTGMVKCPFYLKDYILWAVRKTLEEHYSSAGVDDVDIKSQYDNIVIKWMDRAETLTQYEKRVETYPLSKDVEPIVYTALNDMIIKVTKR